MTVWHEATLPRVPGASANSLGDEPRYTEPYSPPRDGKRASYLGTSPRRLLSVTAADGGDGGAAQPWWWPNNSGDGGGGRTAAHGDPSAAGSLAAMLTKERLSAVNPKKSSPGALLAATLGAELAPAPRAPPPHHNGPVYCDPSRVAQDVATIAKPLDPAMPFGFLAEAVAQQPAAAGEDSGGGLKNLGITNVLIKRKVRRHKMRAGKHAEVWEGCGEPKEVGAGEGIDLGSRPQAITIPPPAGASAGFALKIAIPGDTDGKLDGKVGEAMEEGKEEEGEAAAVSAQEGGTNDMEAAVLEAARLEREAAELSTAAAKELSEAQAADTAASKKLEGAKNALDAAKAKEAEANATAEAATQRAAEAATAQKAAEGTEASAVKEEQQAGADLETQQDLEKAFADALSYQAVGLNAAGKKLNKEEKAQAAADVDAKKRQLRAGPGSKVDAAAQQQAVSAAQGALDASANKKERVQLEAALTQKETQLTAAQSAGVAQTKKEKEAAKAAAVKAREQAATERQAADTAEATAKSLSVNAIAARQAAETEHAEAESATKAASERVQQAEAQSAAAAQKTKEAAESRASSDAAMAAYKAAQVSARCFNRTDQPEAFAELDAQAQLLLLQTSASATPQAEVGVSYGPVVEVLPHGSEFAQPLLMQFNLAAAIRRQHDTTVESGSAGADEAQQPDNDKALVLVLRQGELDAPWLPLSSDEHVSVDAVGNVTIASRSPAARFATLLFRGSNAPIAAADATSHVIEHAATRLHAAAEAASAALAAGDVDGAANATAGGLGASWADDLVPWGTLATGATVGTQSVPTGGVAGLSGLVSSPPNPASAAVSSGGKPQELADYPQSVRVYVSCMQSKLAAVGPPAAAADAAPAAGASSATTAAAATGLGSVLASAINDLAMHKGLKEIRPKLRGYADNSGLKWENVEAHLLALSKDEIARASKDPFALMRKIVLKEATVAVRDALGQCTAEADRAAASAFWTDGLESVLVGYQQSEEEEEILKQAIVDPKAFVQEHCFDLLWMKLEAVAQARGVSKGDAQTNVASRVAKESVAGVVAAVSRGGGPETFFGSAEPPHMEVPDAGGTIYQQRTDFKGRGVPKAEVMLSDLHLVCGSDVDRAALDGVNALCKAGGLGGGGGGGAGGVGGTAGVSLEAGAVVKIAPADCNFAKVHPALKVTFDISAMVEDREGDVCFVALRKLGPSAAWAPLAQDERLTVTESGQANVELRTSCWLALFMLVPTPATSPPTADPGVDAEAPPMSLGDLLKLAQCEQYEGRLGRAGYSSLADLRDLYDFGTPQRVLQWSGSAQHSAEHLSRWEAMSKAMSLAPMDLELSSDAIGMSKGAIKRLRRHLKETGSDLPVEVLSYAVAGFVAHVCETADAEALVLQHESARVSGEEAARQGYVGIAPSQHGALVPGVAAVEVRTGRDGLLWVKSNPRLAQKAAVKTAAKCHEVMTAAREQTQDGASDVAAAPGAGAAAVDADAANDSAILSPPRL